MSAPGRLRIGVTIGLNAPDESLWLNGIKQNALYLAKLFKASPLGHAVCLVNTTTVPITAALPWDLSAFPTRAFADAKDDLDVLIELGGQIGPEETAYLKDRGVRLVSYCCGPEYVQNIEAMIFRRPLWSSIFCNERYDQIWVIPQVVDTSLHFFETLRRRPARAVPFVWDPMAVEARSRDLPHGGEYRPGGPAKRLSVMEPNIDVLKFCLYPMFIAERVYRQRPESIAFLHVTNAERFARESPEFIGIASLLDIVRDHKASFVGSFTTPEFLSSHTDIMISHQWGLPLNYFYFDVCWQGYALVHNAELCGEIGYYYPGADLAAGAAALEHAIDTHDVSWQDYRARQRRLIGRFLATDPDLIAAYDGLLAQLMASEPAP